MNNKIIELNFFTNIMHADPRRIPIFDTINSVDKTFSLSEFSSLTIYIHPHPFREPLDEYVGLLGKFFKDRDLSPKFVHTNGLWDGYVKSIQAASSPYALQMEHDWEFYSRRIKHSASEIVAVMNQENLPYLRFNKRKNGIITGMILHVEERSAGNFRYCVDNVMSNNPHFIDTEYYRKVALPLLLRQAGAGSLGIERELTAELSKGASYGPIGHRSTITHLNGKKIFQKSQMTSLEKVMYRLTRLKKTLLKNTRI